MLVLVYVYVCVYLNRQLKSLRVKFVWKDGKRTGTPKEVVPHDLQLFTGSTHIAASREFVDFALNDRRAQDFLYWLRDTDVPDEVFFNSLNRNPQLNISGSYRGIRYRSHMNARVH